MSMFREGVEQVRLPKSGSMLKIICIRFALRLCLFFSPPFSEWEAVSCFSSVPEMLAAREALTSSLSCSFFFKEMAIVTSVFSRHCGSDAYKRFVTRHFGIQESSVNSW